MEDAEYRSSKSGNSIAFILCCFFYYQIIFLKKDHVFLDYLNLAYHEAGHLFLSGAPELIHIMGGTLGQLFFPLLIAIFFIIKGQKFAASIMGFWFFENFFNIAIYVADAELTELPLVGGNILGTGPIIHDWNYILDHYNSIHKCYAYADNLRLAGNIGLTACLITAFIFLIISFCKKEEE